MSNTGNQNIQPSLTKAFPSILTKEVEGVVKLLPFTKREPEGIIGEITLSNEPLIIPFRIDYPEPDNSFILTLNSTQQVILSCLHTRHTKGRIREKHILRVIAINELWVLPFIFALVAEDVIEIIIAIYNKVGLINKDQVQVFAQENRRFLILTRHRIISFWDLDFRWEWPLFKDYPGYKIMSELGLWNSHDGRRLLR